MKRSPEQQRKKSPRGTPEAGLENREFKPPKQMELKLRLNSHTSYHHKEKVTLLPSGGKLGTCKIVQLLFFFFSFRIPLYKPLNDFKRKKKKNNMPDS